MATLEQRAISAAPGRDGSPAEPPQSSKYLELDGSRTTAPFADVVCAVNGSRGSAEAVRQAIALASPDAALCFVSVWWGTGFGMNEVAVLSERRARKALQQAARLARKAGLSASTESRNGTSASETLLAESESHELMVLGSHGGSRAGGILLGSTATRAVHETSKALLVARRPAEHRRNFPVRVLLASDGSPGSWGAARVAARIARARGSEIQILHVRNEAAPERRRTVSEQLAAIQELTGVEPTLREVGGHVAERIVEAARSEDCSLVVIGRRGLRGVRSLGSVSERVAHLAPCSVVVVP